MLEENFPEGHDRFVYSSWDLSVLPDYDIDVDVYLQYRFSPQHINHDNNAELRLKGTYEIMTSSGSRNAEKLLSGLKATLEDAGFIVEIHAKPRKGLAKLVEAPDVDES